MYQNMKRLEGEIKNYDSARGFGFIVTAEGDLFFHVRACIGLKGAEGEGELYAGRRVAFEMGKARDGRPRAVAVELLP